MYKQYDPEDDQRTVAFWIIAGGIIASLVLKSAVFFLISLFICYVILRTEENIIRGRPYWESGRFTRHLYDSYYRLSKGRYGKKGYRVKKTKRKRF